MALGIERLRVGVWTSAVGPSGCTVILPPEGTLGAVSVRGNSPGTRETAALGPRGKLTVCHAVVLSGGSAYGLATADGVMRWCEQQGIGYPTRAALVPIVGAAIVLDQGVADPAARPGAEAGWAACEAATEDDPPEGSVGAGRGTAVAKVAGLEHCWRGGQGIAVERHGELVVAAIVVNNAVGEIRADDGSWIARARVPDEAGRFPYDTSWLAAPEETPATGDDAAAAGRADAPAVGSVGPTDNTAIGCVVTNARLDKIQAHRVADIAHSGIARAVWPPHTSYDGDALFTLATQRIDADPDLVTTMAIDAVATATRRGPLTARTLPPPHDTIPGLADAPGRRTDP